MQTKKKGFETRREFERLQEGSEIFCDDNECLMDAFLSQYFSFQKNRANLTCLCMDVRRKILF